jgi:hypothetical protein
MVCVNKVCCTSKGIAQAVILDINRELAELDNEPGFAGMQLSRLLNKIGMIDSDLATAEDLIQIRDLLQQIL